MRTFSGVGLWSELIKDKGQEKAIATLSFCERGLWL